MLQKTEEGVRRYFLPHPRRSRRLLRLFLDMPCKKNSLQRQTGFGTLASRQERSAAIVLVVNRLSTACCVPPSIYIGFPLFVLPKSRSRQFVFDAMEGARDGCPLGEPKHRRSILPGCALPRRAPTRPGPPVVYPGFGFVPLVPQSIEDNPPGRFSGSADKGHPM